MSLVNMKEMPTASRKAHKAIGAFNITNYETAAAVLKAAEAENEPVIIQLYMRLFDTGKAYDLCGMLQRLAFRGKVPVALHLDHGSTVKQATDALAWGYTSVMYDGSRSPYDENVKWTKQVNDFGVACILPTSKSTDGVRTGYDLPLIRKIRAITDASVVASGGAGTMEHFAEAAAEGGTGLRSASVVRLTIIATPELKQFRQDGG